MSKKNLFKKSMHSMVNTSCDITDHPLLDKLCNYIILNHKTKHFLQP